MSLSQSSATPSVQPRSSRVNVLASATRLPGEMLIDRTRVTVSNASTTHRVMLGASDVTSTNGIILGPGERFTLDDAGYLHAAAALPLYVATAPLHDMLFAGAGDTVIAIKGNKVHLSGDAGLSWVLDVATLSSAFAGNGSVAQNGNTILVHTGGKIQRSLDGGATWAELATPAATSAVVGYYSGFWAYNTSTRVIYKTTDNGVTWTTYTAPEGAAAPNPPYEPAISKIVPLSATELLLCYKEGLQHVWRRWTVGQPAAVATAVQPNAIFSPLQGGFGANLVLAYGTSVMVGVDGSVKDLGRAVVGGAFAALGGNSVYVAIHADGLSVSSDKFTTWAFVPTEGQAKVVGSQPWLVAVTQSLSGLVYHLPYTLTVPVHVFEQ